MRLMKLPKISLLVCLVGFASSGKTSVIGLRCHTSEHMEAYYELNPSDGSVLILSEVPSRGGRLTVTKMAYELAFPKTPEHWEMRVIINRVSGAYSREFGEPPFFRALEGNISSRGVCERASLQPKL